MDGATWIDVEGEAPNYTIVNDNMTVKNGNWVQEDTALGFADGDVEDLDNGASDRHQCFNAPEIFRCKDVTFDFLTGDPEITAESIEHIRLALQHVTLGAWCPGDI